MPNSLEKPLLGENGRIGGSVHHAEKNIKNVGLI